MNNAERRDNMPGGRIAHWNLFQARVDANRQVIGVDAPNGKFYRFKKGEQLSQVQIPEIPGERVAVITEADGTKRLFESWALDQEFQEEKAA